MVKLPPPLSRTVAAIYRYYEAAREDWRRPHLGASVLGDENCLRHLWYLFRWAMERQLDGQILRLFETGRREEERVVANLRAIGYEVRDIDPATGKQWRVSFFGGHLAGSTDGDVLRVLQAPKTRHLLEAKTMREKPFKKVQKEHVRKAQPGHYTQQQIYMRGRNLKRSLYIAVWKDTDLMYEERVKYDYKHAVAMLNKAERVIFADSPPERISNDPAWFECNLCDHKPVCHFPQTNLLERNCRTCASSTPTMDGEWTCSFYGGTRLSVDDQRKGCPHHLFVPGMLDPWKLIGGSDSERYAVYELPDGSCMMDSQKELTPCDR